MPQFTYSIDAQARRARAVGKGFLSSIAGECCVLSWQIGLRRRMIARSRHRDAALSDLAVDDVAGCVERVNMSVSDYVNGGLEEVPVCGPDLESGTEQKRDWLFCRLSFDHAAFDSPSFLVLSPAHLMDQSWCPVCDKAIEPTRVTVAAADTPAPLARNQSRPGLHGLVHGTGRVKPGGQLKPAENVQNKLRKNGGATATTTDSPSLPPVPPSSPTARTATANTKPRLRTVISDDPTPLYCSDACRTEDANRLADCLSPISAFSSSRSSSSESPDDSSCTYDSASSSGDLSLPGAMLKRPQHLPRLAAFTPLHPMQEATLEPLQNGATTGHSKFEQAAAQRKPRAPPRSPAALEEHPYESRMPPGWRPHEHGQWRKVLYGDFDPRPPAPQRQYSTSALPSPTTTTASALDADNVEPTPRRPGAVHRYSLPAVNDMLAMYNRYNSSMTRRHETREAFSGSGNRSRAASPAPALRERQTSSSTLSSMTSRSASAGSLRQAAAAAEITPLSTPGPSDTDEEMKKWPGFAVGGGQRGYPSLARISSSSSIADLAPPPVAPHVDAMTTMRMRRRSREQVATATAEVDPTRQQNLGRRVMSTGDLSRLPGTPAGAATGGAAFKLPEPPRMRKIKRMIWNEALKRSEEREVDEPVDRRPLFSFAGARS
ncbi:hypothetical protein BKA62DRAFT_672170 [Auriculariales sp. MPI-PUGE-AT-0066]|nr:hypothetical protein BKA62DRAFT_672170 [Auriculariales sp. MPI-PUGE-AT-0066]